MRSAVFHIDMMIFIDYKYYKPYGGVTKILLSISCTEHGGTTLTLHAIQDFEKVACSLLQE